MFHNCNLNIIIQPINWKIKPVETKHFISISCFYTHWWRCTPGLLPQPGVKILLSPNQLHLLQGNRHGPLQLLRNNLGQQKNHSIISLILNHGPHRHKDGIRVFWKRKKDTALPAIKAVIYFPLYSRDPVCSKYYFLCTWKF